MQTVKNSADTQLSQAFVFNASNQQVRTVILNNEPYFVVKDVCAILDISNHIDALSRLDDDEKGRSVIPTQFGAKETNLVNESGLYHLIFQSRKPEAKAFRKWVTAEVLPTLRRTGRYEVKPKPKTVRYPKRDRSIAVDVLELLWLISESLLQGDQQEIALELGVNRQTVGRVLSGESRNSRVLGALYRRALANRKNSVLYTSPRAMARQLLKSGKAKEVEATLPPLILNEFHSGLLGNQNARKYGRTVKEIKQLKSKTNK